MEKECLVRFESYPPALPEQSSVILTLAGDFSRFSSSGRTGFGGKSYTPTLPKPLVETPGDSTCSEALWKVEQDEAVQKVVWIQRLQRSDRRNEDPINSANHLNGGMMDASLSRDEKALTDQIWRWPSTVSGAFTDAVFREPSLHHFRSYPREREGGCERNSTNFREATSLRAFCPSTLNIFFLIILLFL